VSDDRARIRERALAEIAAAPDLPELARLEREYLGKEGAVGRLLASIRDVPPAERKAFGEGANQLKRALEEALAERRAALERARIAAERSDEHFDPSLPAPRPARGSLHPVTHVVRRLEEIFLSMGYAILDGPEVELDYYNFEALNIPSDHPAREMHDTFWCDREQHLLMRTHTSPVQIRALERIQPPFRAIVPGRCFRNETTDASHEHTFHQMEGLVVGEGITVGHLIGTMKTFLREVFLRDALDLDRAVPLRHGPSARAPLRRRRSGALHRLRLRPGALAPGDAALRHRRHPPPDGRRRALPGAVLVSRTRSSLAKSEARSRPGKARRRRVFAAILGGGATPPGRARAPDLSANFGRGTLGA